MKIFDKFDCILAKIANVFCILLMVIIVLGMLFGNSVYLYSDAPAFRLNNVFNYLGVFLGIIIVVVSIFLAKFFEKKYCRKYVIIGLLSIYFVAEMIFLFLAPIQLFSDMLYVVKTALSNFTDGMEYLQNNPNNFPIAVVFNLIFRLTTYNVWSLKIFNCICNSVTIYFAYKLYKNIYDRENILVIILGIVSIAPLLYVNMVYNDILSAMLIVICLYLITKEVNSKFEKVLMSVLLFLQFIIRPVGIIVVIATIMYELLRCKNIKMTVLILSVFLILNTCYNIIENQFIISTEETKPYPIWSYIQMGFNEAEFGFQDNSHSVDWTFEDVRNRITDLGLNRVIKLLLKKEYWLWTEGTYQAERYAFGVGMEDQFYYDTFLTKHLYDFENSKIRNGLEYLMKGQYFCVIILSFISLILKDSAKNKKDLLLYIITGIFCFYLVWEIKSRYIFCLYPIFLVMASDGIVKISNNIKMRKEKHNGKI